jgi:hypothetical protein
MGILPVAMAPQTSLEMTRSVVTHTLTAVKKRWPCLVSQQTLFASSKRTLATPVSDDEHAFYLRLQPPLLGSAPQVRLDRRLRSLRSCKASAASSGGNMS